MDVGLPDPHAGSGTFGSVGVSGFAEFAFTYRCALATVDYIRFGCITS
jgi:hypothetical protein